MALTPTDNEAFFREVDENLRRDQMAGFARSWGRPIAAAVVVLLLALAAVLWWRNHRAEQAGADGEMLAQLLADADVGRAQPTDPRLATLADSPRAGYRAMARLEQAGLQAKLDPGAAAASFDRIAGDTGLPQSTRDLALLRATALRFDTLPPQQVVDRLKPLAVPGNGWFGSAGELTGLAYLRMNRRDLAGPLFAAIAGNADVPTGLRGRAAGMASALGQVVAPIRPAGAQG